MYRNIIRILNVPPAAFMNCNSSFSFAGKCHRHLAMYTNALQCFQTLQKIKFNACIKLNAVLNRRYYSSDSEGDGNKRNPPVLMTFDPVYRPEVMLIIRNWILRKLIIKPYLDNDFTIKDFMKGSKKALEVVSTFLSQGNFESLNGLVTEEAIREIKSNYPAFDMKERQDLAVKEADVLFSFPYQIGIIFDDSNQKRFAEINMVYHVFDNLPEILRQGKVISEEGKKDIKICNYRFIREYTKGVQSDWTINRLGHFNFLHFQR